MTEVEALRAADWEVIDYPNSIKIRRKGNAADAFAIVNKNADGSLHLVKERSAFHRELAGVIAQQSTSAPEGADYTPRDYGS